jgi:mono/diheme cytochrome c family protein
VTGIKWTGAVNIGLAAVALAAIGVPMGQSFAQEPSATVAPDQTRIAKGRDLFSGWGCTSCHALSDAQSSSDVGPHLDGGALTEAFIVGRVANGQGAMPAFQGQLTDEEIADIAYYIAKVAKKQ